MTLRVDRKKWITVVGVVGLGLWMVACQAGPTPGSPVPDTPAPATLGATASLTATALPTATPLPPATATATGVPLHLYVPPPQGAESTAAQQLHSQLQTQSGLTIALHVAANDAELAQAACQPNTLTLLPFAAYQISTGQPDCALTPVLALQPAQVSQPVFVVAASNPAQTLLDLSGQRWAMVALENSQILLQTNTWLLAQRALPAQWEEYPTAADALAAIAAGKAEFTALPLAQTTELSAAWRVLAAVPPYPPAMFAFSADFPVSAQAVLQKILDDLANTAVCSEICAELGYDWQAFVTPDWDNVQHWLATPAP